MLDAAKNGPSAGGISSSRYKIYSDLFEELSHTRIEDLRLEALLYAAPASFDPLAQARQREQRQQKHPDHDRAPHQADHAAQVAHRRLPAAGVESLSPISASISSPAAHAVSVRAFSASPPRRTLMAPAVAQAPHHRCRWETAVRENASLQRFQSFPPPRNSAP